MLLAAATADWLKSAARLSQSQVETATDEHRRLIVNASTILRTISFGKEAPYEMLQQSLLSLVTRALQLTTQLSIGLNTQTISHDFDSELADLVYAIGCYMQHLSLAKPPLPSFQPFQLSVLLPPPLSTLAGNRLITFGASDGDINLYRLQQMVEILRFVCASDGLAHASLRVSSTELVRASYGIAIASDGQLAYGNLRQDVEGLLAGPVSACLVSAGLDSAR